MVPVTPLRLNVFVILDGLVLFVTYVSCNIYTDTFTISNNDFNLLAACEDCENGDCMAPNDCV